MPELPKLPTVVGPRWTAMLAAHRHAAATLQRADVPRAFGVYAWFRDGEPVYAGRAVTKGGLRTRICSRHLAEGSDLSWSSVRRNVCEHLLGIPTSISRQRPSVLSDADVAAVNTWIRQCDVAWVVFPTAQEARDFEDELHDEWRPPLSKRGGTHGR
jgi:hypothetical protein